MGKRYRKMVRKVNGKIREVGGGGVLLEFPLPVAEVIGNLPQLIGELAQEAGILLMTAAMESECERIAGPKHSKNPFRAANWWGSELSPVHYDKQKILMECPRVRGKGYKEISKLVVVLQRNLLTERRPLLKLMQIGYFLFQRKKGTSSNGLCPAYCPDGGGTARKINKNI